MSDHSLPDDFRAFLQSVHGKRARVVVDHILQHGFITTEDLEIRYGYKHPPRAIRDVREQGIPIETFGVKDSAGRSIAAYRFGDPSLVRQGRSGGRRVFPKALKAALYQRQDGRCAICLDHYDARYLQVDHRVPYEVAGEPDDSSEPDQFMLLCGSCNRAKSWSCEHCDNLLIHHDLRRCQDCYWANPHQYAHIALRPVRRIEIVWSEGSVAEYERLRQMALDKNEALPDFVKTVLRRYLQSQD